MVTYFPYNPRRNQEEIMYQVSGCAQCKKNVCINAASGFGKTAAILSSLLSFADEGKKILWAVRTGNATDRPIEELKIICENKNADFFGISYRGKKDMCLLASEMNMKDIDHDDAALICSLKREKGECKYSNMAGFDPDEFKKPMLYSEVLRACKKMKVCPYLAQNILLPSADVISLSYNYIIDEGISRAISSKISFENSILVMDEAHNLQTYGSSLYSSSITLGSLEYALIEIEQEEEIMEERAVLKNMLENFKSELRRMREKEIYEKEISVQDILRAASFGIFELDAAELRAIAGNLLGIGEKIKKQLLFDGKIPRSSAFKVGAFLEHSLSTPGRKGVTLIASTDGKKGDNLKLEIIDMRAADLLREKWKAFNSVVFCSGTLLPIDGFAETIGLKDYEKIIVPSPYTKKNSLTLITKGLSTQGMELDKEMISQYIVAIENFLRVDRNVAIFSASYRIQNDLISGGLLNIIKDKKMKAFVEYEGMSGESGRDILNDFKSSNKAVLIGTAQGRFSEGADFPKSELEGIFLAGVPFDRLNLRTRLYINYYQELYGEKEGRKLSYMIPALRRASQSIGRALRSAEDRAIIVLGDERYSQESYFSLLPDFVHENYALVSANRIGEEADKFWKTAR